MKTLNCRYRGKDHTTDVLSFSLQEGGFPSIQPDMLGDIVISVPAASRQARREGHSINREIDLLIVHGLVHLLGYDHERGPREALRMTRKEQDLLKELAA
jgi:probable rRNA maturation factor